MRKSRLISGILTCPSTWFDGLQGHRFPLEMSGFFSCRFC